MTLKYEVFYKYGPFEGLDWKLRVESNSEQSRIGGETVELSGIGSLILLIVDIYAIVMILQSSARSLEKLIWSLVVFFLPLIGLIIWYFAGPGKKPF